MMKNFVLFGFVCFLSGCTTEGVQDSLDIKWAAQRKVDQECKQYSDLAQYRAYPLTNPEILYHVDSAGYVWYIEKLTADQKNGGYDYKCKKREVLGKEFTYAYQRNVFKEENGCLALYQEKDRGLIQRQLIPAINQYVCNISQ